jgi:DNA-binding MarR family transcriptional regulator
MATDDSDRYAAEAAVRLAVAVKRFRSRMREAGGVTSTGWTLLQLAILSRLIAHGPATAASLALAEHVTQQAVAQSLRPLEGAELIRGERDPRDARKRQMMVTAAGRALVESIYESRDAWLTHAIEATVGPDDREPLESAIELLERIATIELGVRARTG